MTYDTLGESLSLLSPWRHFSWTRIVLHTVHLMLPHKYSQHNIKHKKQSAFKNTLQNSQCQNDILHIELIMIEKKAP